MKLSRKTLVQNASLAWPMTCNALLMQSVTIIDLLLIASLGEQPIAAFGIAGAIVAFILGIKRPLRTAHNWCFPEQWEQGIEKKSVWKWRLDG